MFDIVGRLSRRVRGRTAFATEGRPETETQPPAPRTALHECPQCNTVFIEPGSDSCSNCEAPLDEVSGTL